MQKTVVNNFNSKETIVSRSAMRSYTVHQVLRNIANQFLKLNFLADLKSLATILTVIMYIAISYCFHYIIVS